MLKLRGPGAANNPQNCQIGIFPLDQKKTNLVGKPPVIPTGYVGSPVCWVISLYKGTKGHGTTQMGLEAQSQVGDP